MKNIAPSAAWDSCNTDATVKNESAVNNGNIAVTANARQLLGTPAHLTPIGRVEEMQGVYLQRVERKCQERQVFEVLGRTTTITYA